MIATSSTGFRQRERYIPVCFTRLQEEKKKKKKKKKRRTLRLPGKRYMRATITSATGHVTKISRHHYHEYLHVFI